MTELRDTEQVGAAIRAAAGGVEAPATLRARIAEERLRKPARGRASRLMLLPLAGAAAAVAIVIAVLATGGGDPSLGDATRAALREPTQGPPAKDPRDARFVRASIGGVQFPNYTWYAKRWSTVGSHRDELSGRDALTLTYRAGNRRLGYTIVDGKPLDVPSGARRVTAKGMRLAVLRRGGTLVITWREGGHTCVLASRNMSVDEMVAFASWS
jgi:hypothetical protein